jgi:hypothetical protein
LLQIADAHADARLGEADQRAGSREAPRIGDRHEAAEKVWIEIDACHPSMINHHGWHINNSFQLFIGFSHLFVRERPENRHGPEIITFAQRPSIDARIVRFLRRPGPEGARQGHRRIRRAGRRFVCRHPLPARRTQAPCRRDPYPQRADEGVAGGYIPLGEWRNTPEQKQMMLDYPIENLRLKADWALDQPPARPYSSVNRTMSSSPQ